MGNELGTMKRYKKSEVVDLSKTKLRILPTTVAKLKLIRELILTENDLTDLPPELGCLNNTLKILNAERNAITHIPEEIAQLQRLERLNLSHNRLFFGELQSSIGSLSALTHLELSHNQLDTFPDSWAGLVSLQYIDLSGNEINMFPEVLCRMTNLETVIISENKIKLIPDDIGMLIKLKYLDIHDNKVPRLPSEIGECRELETVDLSLNQLGELPTTVGNWINVKILSLEDNPILDLPNTIIKWSNLQSVNIRNTKLSELSDDIEYWKALTTFEFGNQTYIQEIPPSVGALINLTKLDLSQGRLTTLPEELGQLVNLLKLDISKNELSHHNFPNEALGKLSKLQSLNLGYNKINILPSHLYTLTSLETLILDDNGILIIEDDIGDLTKLQTLQIAMNSLKFIPDAFGSLCSLEVLDVRNNELTYLSPDIAKCSKLKKFNISYNKLVELPVTLHRLVKLSIFEFKDNQLLIPPNPIVAAGVSSIMAYLKEHDTTWNEKDEKKKAMLERKMQSTASMAIGGSNATDQVPDNATLNYSSEKPSTAGSTTSISTPASIPDVEIVDDKNANVIDSVALDDVTVSVNDTGTSTTVSPTPENVVDLITSMTESTIPTPTDTASSLVPMQDTTPSPQCVDDILSCMTESVSISDAKEADEVNVAGPAGGSTVISTDTYVPTGEGTDSDSADIEDSGTSVSTPAQETVSSTVGSPISTPTPTSVKIHVTETDGPLEGRNFAEVQLCQGE
eukprot:CFRG8501T1